MTPEELKEAHFDKLTEHFDNLNEHDSTPSIPLTDVQKVRFSELANDLRQAEIQAYIEANFGTQALNLLQAVVPMLAGLV